MNIGIILIIFIILMSGRLVAGRKLHLSDLPFKMAPSCQNQIYSIFDLNSLCNAYCHSIRHRAHGCNRAHHKRCRHWDSHTRHWCWRCWHQQWIWWLRRGKEGCWIPSHRTAAHHALSQRHHNGTWVMIGCAQCMATTEHKHHARSHNSQ